MDIKTIHHIKTGEEYVTAEYGIFETRPLRDPKCTSVCGSQLACEVLSVETSGRSPPPCGTGPEIPAQDREQILSLNDPVYNGHSRVQLLWV